MPTRYDPPLTLAERRRRRERLAAALDLAREDTDARATLRRAIAAMDARCRQTGT
jgi:hypothetical protein